MRGALGLQAQQLLGKLAHALGDLALDLLPRARVQARQARPLALDARVLLHAVELGQRHVEPVGAAELQLHAVLRAVPGHGHRLQAPLFEADAQLTGHDLNEVLGFQGRSTRQQVAQHRVLGGRAARLSDFAEALGNHRQRQRLCGRLPGGEHLGCRRAKVAVLAIDERNLGFIGVCCFGQRPP